MIWIALCALVLIASILGGLVGFGTAAILLPFLSFVLGVNTAVPVLGVAMILANASRAVFSWKDIDWKVVGTFSLAAIPASIAGALLYVGTPGKWISVVIGCILLIAVIARRITAKREMHMTLPYFFPLGGIVGGVSGIGGVVGVSGIGGVVGPVAAPFMLSYGLIGSSYLATEGINSMLVHAVKSVVYWNGGSMTIEHLYLGLMFGGIMVLGSYLGRRLVDKFEARQYLNLIDASIVALGLLMIIEPYF